MQEKNFFCVETGKKLYQASVEIWESSAQAISDGKFYVDLINELF